MLYSQNSSHAWERPLIRAPRAPTGSGMNSSSTRESPCLRVSVVNRSPPTREQVPILPHLVTPALACYTAHMPDDQQADVALRETARSASSAVLRYRVPPRLRGLVLPGQLVWVPLQRRQVQGIVLSLVSADYPPGDTLRDIDDLADPEAVIPANGLLLAQRVAATYRAPLYEVLALMLPPGVAQASEITWRATSAGIVVALGTLPERERAILYYLRTHGETSERELRRELRGGDNELREAYAFLLERGLAARGTILNAPRVRPRRQRMVRLCVSTAELTIILDSLKHASRQLAVLRWLFERQQTIELTLQADGQAAEQHPDLETPLPTAILFPVTDIYADTGANLAVLRTLEQKQVLVLETHEVRRDPLAGDGVAPDVPPPLTTEQRRVWEPISRALDTGLREANPTSTTFVLHGVTGSGKTEIYLRAIGRTLRLGRQALVLVPEIALTTQLVRRFAARFPGRLAVLHSRLALGERYDEWRRLRRGEASIAIGSRSAVFAPLPDLGLIIVDEEHEPTYKHDGSPRFHARDVAVQLGELTGSVVILGSATPSVESYYAARSGRFRLLEMTERVGKLPSADGLPRTRTLPLPHVQLVDMRRELQEGNRSIFSRALHQAIGTALAQQQQVILFLNRRGAASSVVCRDCGHTATCPNCHTPLTLHYDDSDATASDEPASLHSSLLICHTCGHHAMIPTICSHCLSPRIKAFGVGTQRVEEEVHRWFADARVLRWDRDSVVGKDAHSRFLDHLLRRETDVLIGTQMIAKGLDLPHVSVVGVVAADTALNLPDFRSGERTFQLLTQVAGRAGRHLTGAQVVIQTYSPDHYALRAAQEHDYHAFYTQEIAFRRQVSYPPYGRLVRFICSHSSQATCQRNAQHLAEQIYATATRLHLDDWGLIGPAPAFLQRIRGRWRWHLLVRIADPFPLLDALQPLYGWIIDVDPVHVL